MLLFRNAESPRSRHTTNSCCFDTSQSTAAFTSLVLSKNCGCKNENAKVEIMELQSSAERQPSQFPGK